MQDARAAAQAHTSEIAGTLHITASPLLATYLLVPALAGFRKLYPNVTFDVTVERADTTPVTDFDVKLLSAPAGFNGNLIARPIVTTLVVLCASPEYLQEHPIPLTPEDLQQHDFLQFRNPERRSGSVMLTNPDTGGSVVEVPVRPVCESNYVDVLLRALLDGAGIGAQPLGLAAPYITSGRLVRILAPWTAGQLTLYAALPSRKFLPARTLAFLDYLTERTRNSVHKAMSGASACDPI